jgi:hypothetical protein
MDSLPHAPSPHPAITPPRKILCALALAVAALSAMPGAVSAAPPRLTHVALSQAGRELIFTVRTGSPVALSRLQPQPDTRRAAARYLCLALSRPGGSGELRLCLGGKHARRRVGQEVVNAAGRPTKQGSVRATVKRPNPNELVVALVPGDAGLAPRRYSWRTIESQGCEPGGECAQALPAGGAFAFRLRPVRAVGCTGGGAGLVTNGPRDAKIVALTFDDGPSEYTAGFLQVLREKGVHGTFFEVGQEMPGREATMRQILAEGNEIGDHTENHVEYPGYAQIPRLPLRDRQRTPRLPPDLQALRLSPADRSLLVALWATSNAPGQRTGCNRSGPGFVLHRR